MIKRLSAVVCVAGVTFFASGLANAEEIKPVPVTGNIQWIHSYAEGQKVARESGKPLFVVFRCER